MCHRCWQRAQNALRRPVQNAHPDQNEAATIHSAIYRRAPNTSAHCIFNNCRNQANSHIPETIKVYLLCEHNLYVPQSARSCREHLLANVWDELVNFCNVTQNFNSAQFDDICNTLTKAVRHGKQIDFETVGAITDDEMHFWTGLKNRQFDIILQETPSLLESHKKPRLALGIYLYKLRTGESNERLASQFNTSRRSIQRILKIVRYCLLREFVPQHLGFDHMQRNNVLERNLTIHKGIFGNQENTKAIIICDGTYAYIQKSSNFLFQRLTYSLHKFQNLLKPFLIVCSDGYIIDILGPFAATKSDASIMSDFINDENSVFHWFFEQNDVLILDRGFRDCVPGLEACGYKVHLPPTKESNDTQLSTEQANKSRLVTLCRWVVEVINGRFKRDFKLLRQDYFNTTLRNLFPDFKIAGALINSFREPVTDNVDAQMILDSINQRINIPNHLYNYVNDKNLNRQRIAFVAIDVNQQLDYFPRLTESDLKLFTLGSYQLKLAKSYCAEHLHNGLYIIEVKRDDLIGDLQRYNMPQNVWLLRGRIQSRHVRAKTYLCYLLVIRDAIGISAIAQYYCTCLTGRRTIGSCAHITSIVWYLGVGRHEPFNSPAGDLISIIIDED